MKELPSRVLTLLGAGSHEKKRREVALAALALDIGAPVTIRISARARRLSIRVDSSERQVELILPDSVAPGLGLKFLKAKRGWIAARLASLPQRTLFVEGAEIPVFGVPHRIRHEPDPKAALVACAESEIRVRGEAAHLPRRVRDHLVDLARRELAIQARREASRIGKRVARISVRDTKSRWGSCSAQGNLSFSWRLILAPRPVLDYVVAHEVAHLAEMNHGPKFWRLVDELYPDWQAARDWLKRNRNILLAYG